MASSKDPGTLGIYGFRNRADHSYDKLAIATSLMVKEPRIWDILSDLGKHSIVVGVPGTYPITKGIKGCLITSFLTPNTTDPKITWTHPPGLRVEVTDSRSAPYTVRVVQQYPASRRMPFGAAGQSLVLAPLGGYGSVSFLMLGSLAVAYAPPGSGRQDIIEGIGRGIGRAAAHELAHQLLPRVNIHAARDERSYEFERAARAGQYYGPAHWEIARPLLEERVGTREK